MHTRTRTRTHTHTHTTHTHTELYTEPMFEAHSQEQASMGYPLHCTKYSGLIPVYYK